MRLDIDTTYEGSAAVVRVEGSIDLDSKTALRAAGEAALDASGVTTLVIDMAAVQFMDSTGIGTLVDLSSRADERGIAFQIRDPSTRVERVLTITGLSQLWSLVHTDGG